MSGFVLNKATKVAEGVDERYQHHFGGRNGLKGSVPPGCSLPLHLLYTFDTLDPAFPLRVEGVRLLPLCFSFTYNGGACGYRVRSDNEIQVLYMETREIEREFPFNNYPSEFPLRKVRLEPLTYEQHKTLVFSIEAGKEALSAADRKLIFDDLKYPFTQLGGVQFMWQGIPQVHCPNPECEYSRYSCFMEVFAVVWDTPVDGVSLWSDNEYKSDVQVIFQICPKCRSIHVCNRCD